MPNLRIMTPKSSVDLEMLKTTSLSAPNLFLVDEALQYFSNERSKRMNSVCRLCGATTRKPSFSLGMPMANKYPK